MKKNGFTLVELLAVIVILAIILVIGVPKIIGIIDNTKLKTIEDTSNIIASQAETEYFKRKEMGTLDQSNDPITCDDIVTISNADYKSCSIDFSMDGTAYVSIYGNGRLDGYYCISSTKDDANCNIQIGVYKESILNGAYPRITEGMIPVTIADDGTVTTVSPTSSSWYSYENKQWANVVLVKETGIQTRSYYQTNYNVTVDESDILAYLVWIPRYRYTLWNVAGNAATYTSDTTCTANCPQSISITFENADTTKSTGSTNGSQLTHPAFTYNGVELNGIWVGKFETTPIAGSTCATTPNSTNCLNVNPTIKPNVPSLRYQNLSTEFTTSLLFGTNAMYGLTGESRMSKNADWGAIVYLSHSTYGINTEIGINNQNGSKTGCGGTGGSTPTCSIAYGSGVSSYPQSTTGNISGIFDMSGGAWEYQMGAYTNATNDKYSGTCDYYQSGFKGIYGNPSYNANCNSSITNNTTGLDYPNDKYYRLYKTADLSVNSISNLGEALGETNSWYKDYNYFVVVGSPWFLRSGSYGHGVYAGGFNFYYSNGSPGSGNYYSFRSIVITS